MSNGKLIKNCMKCYGIASFVACILFLTVFTAIIEGKKAVKAQQNTKLANQKVQAVSLRSKFSSVKTSLKNRYLDELENLLSHKKWMLADIKTSQLMLHVANIRGKANLDIESIQNISCSNLKKIDQLWVKYSNGRFGFSVQKQTWLEVKDKTVNLPAILSKVFLVSNNNDPIISFWNSDETFAYKSYISSVGLATGFPVAISKPGSFRTYNSVIGIDKLPTNTLPVLPTWEINNSTWGYVKTRRLLHGNKVLIWWLVYKKDVPGVRSFFDRVAVCKL